jgi:hypothetical protein
LCAQMRRITDGSSGWRWQLRPAGWPRLRAGGALPTVAAGAAQLHEAGSGSRWLLDQAMRRAFPAIRSWSYASLRRERCAPSLPDMTCVLRHCLRWSMSCYGTVALPSSALGKRAIACQ